MFQNLKTYDSHLIMQELGKLNLKINFLLNGEENIKFYSLVRILGKDDLKYLNQEFHDNVLDPVKQKEIYPYEYRVILKNS